MVVFIVMMMVHLFVNTSIAVIRAAFEALPAGPAGMMDLLAKLLPV